jgi:inner membrane protein
MNPATHFLAGWLIANVDHLERRDRALVILAAVIPDLDGLGILSDIASKDHEAGLIAYGQYHHVLAHNVFFGLLLATVVYAVSKKRVLAASLVLLSFHIHLLGDLLSGRGPDGTVWTISYLYPVLKDV